MEKRTSTVDWRAVGHRLRVARIQLGISELEAAGACKVSLRTYRRYVAGSPQRFSGVIDFAIKFDLSLDWLAQGEGGHVRLYLAERAPGKIAILPAIGPGQRRRQQSH